jgi:hypothetical protein
MSQPPAVSCYAFGELVAGHPYGLPDSGSLIAPLPHPTGRDSPLPSLARPLVRLGLLPHTNCLSAENESTTL